MIKPINQSTCEKLQLTSNQLISCTSHGGRGGGKGGRRFPRAVHSSSRLPSLPDARGHLESSPGAWKPGAQDVPRWLGRPLGSKTKSTGDGEWVWQYSWRTQETFALIEHPLTATCTIFVGRKFEIPTKSEQLLCLFLTVGRLFMQFYVSLLSNSIDWYWLHVHDETTMTRTIDQCKCCQRGRSVMMIEGNWKSYKG